MNPSVVIARDETAELLEKLKAINASSDSIADPVAGISTKSNEQNPTYFAWEEELEQDDSSEVCNATEEVNESSTEKKEQKTSSISKEVNEVKEEIKVDKEKHLKKKKGPKRKNKNKVVTTFAPWGTWINAESAHRTPFIPPCRNPSSDMDQIHETIDKITKPINISAPFALDIDENKVDGSFDFEEDIELPEDDFVLVGSPRAKKESSPVVEVLPPWGIWEDKKESMIQKGNISQDPGTGEEEEAWSLDSEDKVISEYQKEYKWHKESPTIVTSRRKLAEKNSARGVTYTLTGGEKPDIPMSPKEKKMKKEASHEKAAILLQKAKNSDQMYSILHPPTEVDKTFDRSLLHKSDNLWPLIEDGEIGLKKGKDRQQMQMAKEVIDDRSEKEENKSKQSDDPAIDDNTIKHINQNHVDHVGALLKMLSVNENLPSKSKTKEVTKSSNEKETYNDQKSSTSSKGGPKTHPKTSNKNKLITRKKKEKKSLSMNTKSMQSKKKRDHMQEHPKSIKMNPITHSYVWPPPLPSAPKTEYDDVYKWPCYLSSPKASVVTGL